MSSTPPPRTPLRYAPSVEVIDDDETQTMQGLIDQMTRIQNVTYKDGGHALRGVHAKSQGLIEAQLVVVDGLPAHLAQGLFARAGSYPVVMRFSAVPGDVLDDAVSTPRGLAVKVIGVDGPRLSGSEAATTQDFVMINGPAFGAPNAKKFLGTVKLLAGTTDKAPVLKKVLSTALQGIEKVVEAVGGKSPTLISLGGHPETNILGETYYTQTPFLFGDYIAKLCVAPSSAGLEALTNAKVDLSDRPNGLRQAVVDFFATHGGEWEVKAQLCTNLESMPIEDASVAWPEDESPYVTVARIVAEPQAAWSHERSRTVDDGMAFNPWHGLAAHQPLGSINRARKQVYEMSKRFRAAHNGVTIDEPAMGPVLD
jgi:hypothetical protein